MNKRWRAGLAIAATRGMVDQVAVDQWRVASQSADDKAYLVTLHTNPDEEEAYECECPDHVHRVVNCKHIFAVGNWRTAEAYVIALIIRGEGADESLAAFLQEKLLGWLDDTQRDKYKIVWNAYQCVTRRLEQLQQAA